MTDTPSAPHRMGLPTLILAAASLGILAGGVAVITAALGLAPVAITKAVAVLVAGLAALVFTGRWWKGADEAVREAHKSSWYWGGSTGLLLAGSVAVALASVAFGGGGDQFGLSPAEAGLIVTGAGMTVALMLLGYGLFWTVWWLRRGR